MKEALRRVKANKGSPGVDGMTVGGITDYLKQHWPAIREQLLNGTYEPKPVRRVEIDKPDGGVRKLGIPGQRRRSMHHLVRGQGGQPSALQGQCWIGGSSRR
jgi:retron-type reverse transcriptase